MGIFIKINFYWPHPKFSILYDDSFSGQIRVKPGLH